MNKRQHRQQLFVLNYDFDEKWMEEKNVRKTVKSLLKVS